MSKQADTLAEAHAILTAAGFAPASWLRGHVLVDAIPRDGIHELWLRDGGAPRVLAPADLRRLFPSTQQPTDAALGDARERAVTVLGFHDGAFDGGFFGARDRVAALIERNDAEVASLRYHAESISAEARELRRHVESMKAACDAAKSLDALSVSAEVRELREAVERILANVAHRVMLGAADCQRIEELAREALAASLHGEGT